MGTQLEYQAPGEIVLNIPLTRHSETSCNEPEEEQEPTNTTGSHGWRYWDIVDNLFPPPVVAAVLGVIFGLTPAFRGLLLPESASFGWVVLALRKFGDAAPPINMLILGSALSQGPQWSAVTKKAAVLVSFAKMIVMPCLGFCTVVALRRAMAVIGGNVPKTAWLTALVVLATPTANNLNVMCELAGQNRNAMATTIFVQYMLAPFAMVSTVMCILLFVEE